MDVGWDWRPFVGYTEPVLEVSGGIESLDNGLFDGTRVFPKLARLAAYELWEIRGLETEGNEVSVRVCFLFDLRHRMF